MTKGDTADSTFAGAGSGDSGPERGDAPEHGGATGYSGRNGPLRAGVPDPYSGTGTKASRKELNCSLNHQSGVAKNLRQLGF